MKSLMVKDLRPGLPERGKIKIGIKGRMITSKRGNEFQPPEKLDHFIVTTTERGADGNFKRDEAIHAKLGDKPTEIPVYLPFNDIDLNLQTRYACYNGRQMWCAGDGESAMRLQEGGTRTQVPCTCERIAPDFPGQGKCKINGVLSVMIRDVGGFGGVWKFRTTSFNSVTGLMSTLALLKATTGGPLAGIALTLRVAPKTVVSPSDGKVQTIYVVSLEYAGSMEELRDKGYQIALSQAKTKYSIENIENDVRKMLAPPDAPLPGDDAEEIGEEFYPEGQVNRETGELLPREPGRPNRAAAVVGAASGNPPSPASPASPAPPDTPDKSAPPDTPAGEELPI